MRAWKPADVFCHCGADPRHNILKGELYQSIKVPKVNGSGWIDGERKRCRACADESPELQRDVEPSRPPLGVDFTHIGDVDKPNLKDWKQLTAGREVEP